MTNNYITNCNRNNDSYCPIFQVGDMLKEAEPNEKNRQDILTKGGVLQFSINIYYQSVSSSLSSLNIYSLFKKC